MEKHSKQIIISKPANVSLHSMYSDIVLPDKTTLTRSIPTNQDQFKYHFDSRNSIYLEGSDAVTITFNERSENLFISTKSTPIILKRSAPAITLFDMDNATITFNNVTMIFLENPITINSKPTSDHCKVLLYKDGEYTCYSCFDDYSLNKGFCLPNVIENCVDIIKGQCSECAPGYTPNENLTT